jgi:CitMHS family citrate-Mg2+:H+ or citrate-Ca2+:H+ symporter
MSRPGRVVCLGAGVMNTVPWGGPTARAMATLHLSSGDIFVPAIPAMVAGILWVLVAAFLIGRSERRRLVFTPAAYYFGVLPVQAETSAAFGGSAAEVGTAAILGQMTTGFPLLPLTAPTFILVGMSGVDLGAHQRFIFKWAFGTTLGMTVVALVTGAISF